MTNLKKVIALTLAATSAFGTLASATFTDNDEISNGEAVDTLTALGIIKGFEDGSFRPEETVTRAEMAKMIFTIKNGGNDDASAFAGISSSFTDVNGHWAAGYIKYCENQGIIAGYADGSFRPEDNVTGTEAIKMALVTLGYDATISGLEGVSWASNTMSLGIDTRLTDDYIGNYSSSSAREDAAQVLYNALYADVVRYDSSSNGYVGKYYPNNYGMNLATDAMGLVEVEGTVEGVSEGRIIVDGTSYDATADYINYVGQDVTVLIKTSSNKADVVYGLKPDSKTKSIVSTHTGVSYDDKDEASTLKATVNGVTIKGFTEGAWAVLTGNGDGTESSDGVTVVGYSDPSKYEIAKNDTVIIAKNDNNEATVYIIPLYVGEVTYTNDDKIIVTAVNNTTPAISGETSFEYDDNQIASSVAEDDFVSITYSKFLDCYVVEEISKQTGTVTAIKDKEFQIGGTWYTIYDGSTLSINDVIEFHAVGKIIYNNKEIDSELDLSDYISVLTVADNAVTSDGTGLDGEVQYYSTRVMDYQGNISVVKVSGLDADDDLLESGVTKPTVGLYSYDTEDGYYILTAIDASDFDDVFTSGTNDEDFVEDGENTTLGGYTIDDSAVIHVQYDDNTEYKVISGAELKNWDEDDMNKALVSSSYVAYGKEVNGFGVITIAYINLNSTSSLPGEASDIKYGYVTADIYQTKYDGDDYLVVSVFTGTETKDFYVEGKLASHSISKGNLIAYTTTDGVEITVKDITSDDLSVYGSDTVQVSAWNGSTRIALAAYENGADTFTIDLDSVPVLYLDTSDKKGVSEGGKISQAWDTDGSGEKESNAVAIIDDEDKLVALYIDVDGNFETAVTWASKN